MEEDCKKLVTPIRKEKGLREISSHEKEMEFNRKKKANTHTQRVKLSLFEIMTTIRTQLPRKPEYTECEKDTANLNRYIIFMSVWEEGGN